LTGCLSGNKIAEMAGETITLEFLAAQQRQILDELALVRTELAGMRAEMALMRDDNRVLTAMAMRQDNSSKTMLDLIHMITDRLRRLETV